MRSRSSTGARATRGCREGVRGIDVTVQRADCLDYWSQRRQRITHYERDAGPAILPTMRISSSSVVGLQRGSATRGEIAVSLFGPKVGSDWGGPGFANPGAYGPRPCCSIDAREVGWLAERYSPKQPPRYVHVGALFGSRMRLVGRQSSLGIAESESPAACSLRRMMGSATSVTMCRVSFLGRAGSGSG
jgi:hypothetical protein